MGEWSIQTSFIAGDLLHIVFNSMAKNGVEINTDEKGRFPEGKRPDISLASPGGSNLPSLEASFAELTAFQGRLRFPGRGPFRVLLRLGAKQLAPSP